MPFPPPIVISKVFPVGLGVGSVRIYPVYGLALALWSVRSCASHSSWFSSGLRHGKRHKYLQVRCDLQMASIYFFCMKTEFTGFSVLSYQLLAVKSQIYHKKCCHKIKFMFIYNSCITLDKNVNCIVVIYSQARWSEPPKNPLMNLLFKSWIRC